MPDDDLPFDPAALRAMWDFSAPEVSAERFATALSGLEPMSVRAGELTTQLARARGLAGAFPEGHRLLDDLAGDDPGGLHPVVRVRVALERGRLRNSGGDPAAAIPDFREAVRLAQAAGRDDLAADALHMLAIADGDGEAAWYAQGVALASGSDEPPVRRWLGPFHTNHGWALHDAGHFDEALDAFAAALAAYREAGDAEGTRIAEWTVARGLRSLGRRDEALAIQRRLKATGLHDRYVDEEIAILEQEQGERPGKA
ncbi:MAG: tetratricopeptide repeat protein [Thermomicrobiales bacterium]